MALGLEREVAALVPNPERVRSVHVLTTRTQSVITVKVYLDPLTSKEQPEPEPFIFVNVELWHQGPLVHGQE